MVLACAPTMLASISQSKFENVKKFMNRCVDHVVGEAPPTTASLIGVFILVGVVFVGRSLCRE